MNLIGKNMPEALNTVLGNEGTARSCSATKGRPWSEVDPSHRAQRVDTGDREPGAAIRRNDMLQLQRADANYYGVRPERLAYEKSVWARVVWGDLPEDLRLPGAKKAYVAHTERLRPAYEKDTDESRAVWALAVEGLDPHEIAERFGAPWKRLHVFRLLVGEDPMFQRPAGIRRGGVRSPALEAKGREWRPT